MRSFVVPCCFLVCLLITVNSHAQNNLSTAQSLANSGKFTEAIRIYSEILAADPKNTKAELGRGYTYSWNHDFNEAIADFTDVLRKEPNNIEAQKGMAYAELWSGNSKDAVQSFKNLLAKQPGNKEFYIALGQAQLNEGLLIEARRSFEKAKELDPKDYEPVRLINAVRTKPTILDVDILAGISSTGGKSQGGLRFVQVSSQVTKKVQLAAKYDNSLSLDNLGLIVRNKTAPYYAGSVQYKWTQHLLTKVEGGFRNFSGAKSNEATGESQFSLEQVFFLKNNKAFKIGAALLSPNIGKSSYLLFTGYHQAVSKNVAAGINYFYSNRNVKNTTENRFLADADFYLPKGKTLNAGFYYGKQNSDDPVLSGNTYGGFLRGYFPVTNAIGIHLAVAAENNFIQNLFNANAGLRFRLEK